MISPEPATTVAAFASARAIRYPILADSDSSVVRAYGILNPNVRPKVTRVGLQVPFPGQYLLDRIGTVLGKSFSGDLRRRASGTMLVEETFGSHEPPVAIASTDDLELRLAMSTRQFYTGQEAAVSLEVRLAQGVHVYAHDVRLPYVGIDFCFEPDGPQVFSEQSYHYPAPGRLLGFAALGEVLPVHDGRFRVTGRVRVQWWPPPHPRTPAAIRAKLSQLALPLGPRVVTAQLRYQPCSDVDCGPPGTATVAVPITILSAVDSVGGSP